MLVNAKDLERVTIRRELGPEASEILSAPPGVLENLVLSCKLACTWRQEYPSGVVRLDLIDLGESTGNAYVADFHPEELAVTGTSVRKEEVREVCNRIAKELQRASHEQE